MRYRALVSFTGVLTMRKNEVREITDKNLIKDLLSANYIEEVRGSEEKPVKPKKKKTS